MEASSECPAIIENLDLGDKRVVGRTAQLMNRLKDSCM